jgi:glutamate formiminotransferase
MIGVEMPLIECIPNFSEGRDETIIQALVRAIGSQAVHVLDVHRDADHNRSVVTFAGEPDAVVEAAFLGIQAAAHLIDLRQHEGVHPRIGAADVVPFVPLRDADMTLCVALARGLGQRVAEELGIPVYLYEEAAQRPERRDLAYVRRGGYERLCAEIMQAERLPDYGRAALGSAGAVAIGARAPLIAFNAYLDTDDVETARAIAGKIRASSGGLPFLKAIGVLVNGQAQVSMNIVDFQQMPLFTIMQTLHQLAVNHHVQVTHTELIGLTPEKALLDYAVAMLGLPAETRHQTLEYRLGLATGDYRPLFE